MTIITDNTTFSIDDDSNIHEVFSELVKILQFKTFSKYTILKGLQEAYETLKEDLESECKWYKEHRESFN